MKQFKDMKVKAYTPSKQDKLYAIGLLVLIALSTLTL